MGCLMALVSKLPCVPRNEPMKTVCLACTGILFSGGAFAVVILALWRAIVGGHAAPSPPSAPGSTGGGGDEVTQTGVFNFHNKLDVSLALGGIAIALIVLMVIYGAGSWMKKRPARLVRSMALATRDQHIDRELGILSDRVAALGAVPAPVVQQPQQVVRYDPPGQISKYVSPTTQPMVPIRYQGDFADHMEAMQEGGYIRAVEEDRGVLQEAGWVWRPRVLQVPIQGPRPQGVPRASGGTNQEQFARGHEYYEDGAQTAGAAINSTGMAA